MLLPVLLCVEPVISLFPAMAEEESLLEPVRPCPVEEEPVKPCPVEEEPVKPVAEPVEPVCWWPEEPLLPIDKLATLPANSSIEMAAL